MINPAEWSESNLNSPTVLEVHQFSRDAGVAEAWLLGQEPYLSSREIGQSVDEVEKLIKRHEAFEKSAATWEERFAALERLTTVRMSTVQMDTKEREVVRLTVRVCVCTDGVTGSEENARGRGEEETAFSH